MKEIIAKLLQQFENKLRTIFNNEARLRRERKKLFNTLKETFENSVKAELEFMSEEQRAAIVDGVEKLLSDFTRLERMFDRRITEELKDGIKKNKTFEQMRARIDKITRGTKGHAWTLTATGLGAINEAKRIDAAIKQGYEFFKYVGPVPERKFCKEHWGKVYTVGEIKQMDNGQGLEVLYYRGGYNCTHTWQPLTKEQALRLRERVKIKTEGSSRGYYTNILRNKFGLKVPDFFDEFTDRKALDKTISQLEALKNTYQWNYRIIYREERDRVFASSTTTGLGLNKKYFNNHDTFVKVYNRGVKDRFHFPVREGEEVNSVVSHEYAHSLTLTSILTKDDFYKKLRSIKTRYSRLINGLKHKRYRGEISEEQYKSELERNYISEYAETNIDEFVAESFAMYLHGSNPSPFALEVGKLMDEYFKKKG